MIKTIFHALISIVTVFSISHYSALAMFEKDENKPTKLTVLQMKKLYTIRSAKFFLEEKIPFDENSTIIIKRKFQIGMGSEYWDRQEKVLLELKKLPENSVLSLVYNGKAGWESKYPAISIGEIEIKDL